MQNDYWVLYVDAAGFNSLRVHTLDTAVLLAQKVNGMVEDLNGFVLANFAMEVN